jgi:hypothetical protein
MFRFTFALPNNSGTTFHVDMRDHDCVVMSSVFTKEGVAANGDIFSSKALTKSAPESKGRRHR